MNEEMRFIAFVKLCELRVVADGYLHFNRQGFSLEAFKKGDRVTKFTMNVSEVCERSSYMENHVFDSFIELVHHIYTFYYDDIVRGCD